ncbi:Rne/Rng family ribonuclease [Cellulomonas sp. APG4]|uniref:Rne/Rng family ribonuclease n=1 Tax=Cellulomonas sp. APG4 TaxID=1538656 RepID=UPI00351B8A0F
MTTENTQGESPTADAATTPESAQPRRRSRRATSASTTPAPAAPVVTAADVPAAQADDASTGTPAAPAPAEKAPEVPARARRSRRATSPATAPTADAAHQEAGRGANDTAEASSEVSEAPVPAEAPAPRTRRRKATAKATAAADDAAGTEATTAPAADAAPGSTAPAEGGAPARRGARRKKPATEATEGAATATSSEEVPPGESAAEDEKAPRARKGRGTTKRKAADTATAEAATPPGSPAEREAPLDVMAELGGRTTPRAGESPRLATTALLFQAPEPDRPRRRRAQAPAGPPVPVEDAEITGEEVADEDVEETTTADAAQEGEGASEDTTPDEGQDEQDEQDEESAGARRRRRRRGGRGRRSRGGDRGEDGDGDADAGDDADGDAPQGGAASEDDAGDESDGEEGGSSSRRRRRRRRSGGGGQTDERPSRSTRSGRTSSDEVTALKGSTRLEAKRQRRREGRDAGRRRTVVTEAEFLARREAVERAMIVREQAGRVQIAVLEDNVLVEHFVSRSAQNAQSSMAGNVYLGRVQNVLPSMEAAFVDVGKGRNAVLYAGEVNWDAAGLEGQPRRIEQALKSGDSVLVQVTKDPIGHKGARLTSQITLAGRYLVYVPGGGMTGISRKLPENERSRLKKLLKEIVPDAAGVIVRTAAEGASDEELRRDVQRLQDQWAAIEKKARTASAPALLQGEPDLAIRVVRDIFNDDFRSLVVQGDDAWSTISDYVQAMAPDLADRVSRWAGEGDVFSAHRIDEQLAKGMDRKVWLPSGGSLVIDRTEAMTVIDVNTGKFTGAGGTLEETVTRNNLEAAEEIVRQLRLRDIGGIIVIDFIDMVLESNRDLVLRRLVECLGRDRTKHQVAEVTSLGLVQMTRKRVGQGLVEAFSETCEHCHGRGFLVHSDPVEAKGGGSQDTESEGGSSKRSRRKKGGSSSASGAPSAAPVPAVPVLPAAREAVKATLATIAAAAAHAHEHEHEHDAVTESEHGDGPSDGDAAVASGGEAAVPSGGEAAVPSGGEAAAAELDATVASVAAVETEESED